MRTGAAISGGLHAAFLAVALFGVDWFSDLDSPPLNVTEVEFIDGTEFDALVSSAPTVATDNPTDMVAPGEGDPAPERPEPPEDVAKADDAPELTNNPAPDEAPEPPTIAYRTPTDVPTEAPKPSIAEIPSPDPLDRQSREPESAPSTEPVAPLAALDAPTPGAKPTPPPEPEPEPKEPEKDETVTAPSPVADNERTPDPEPDRETDPTSTAETSPEAPEGPAPREAKLPLAKPADLAAAAEAARREEEERIAKELAEQERKTAETRATEPADKPERTAQNTGGSTERRGPPLNRTEKNALRLGIKKYYTYSGDMSDRTLKVKVVVKLSERGEIVGKPKVVGAKTSTEHALGRAGTRALLRAEANGEFKRLPPDKYFHWKQLNVFFTIDRLQVSG